MVSNFKNQTHSVAKKYDCLPAPAEPEACHVSPSLQYPQLYWLWFGLVRIRSLRSVLTISEPWDEGDGFE